MFTFTNNQNMQFLKRAFFIIQLVKINLIITRVDEDVRKHTLKYSW